MPYRMLMRALAVIGLFASIALLATACSQPTATPLRPGDGVLRLAAPAGALPAAVLDAFTRSTGIAVEMRVSAEPEAALRAGEAIDLALLPTEALPGLVEDGLLAPLDFARIPGFRAVPASFRDLAFDPGNRHSVPFRYGVTGIVLRMDGLTGIPSSWDAVLDPAAGFRLALFARPREAIGAGLLAAGQDVNAEDPEALDLVLDRWLSLDPERLTLLAPDDSAVAVLAGGEADLLIGQASDLAEARDAGLDVGFVVPAEGGLLWIDHLTIPAASLAQADALRLLNHLLQPEVAAEVARAQAVAVANDDLAYLLEPERLADRTVWPSATVLRRARLLLPLEPAGRALHAAVWEQLLAVLAEPGP